MKVLGSSVDALLTPRNRRIRRSAATGDRHKLLFTTVALTRGHEWMPVDARRALDVTAQSTVPSTRSCRGSSNGAVKETATAVPSARHHLIAPDLSSLSSKRGFLRSFGTISRADWQSRVRT
jgi:hypothetical protein